MNINALSAVSFDGTASNGFSSGVFSTVEPGGVGKGGDIRINTGSLSITNGAELFTGTLGYGNAGNVTINAAKSVSLDGTASNGFSSGVFSTVGSVGVGNAGNITIQAGALSLASNAQVVASALGVGNAGNINIRTKDTISLDGGSTISSTLGASTARGVSVRLDNQRRPIITLEPLRETIFPNAKGNSGNINISTNLLAITNGSRLTTNTFGQGNAGNIDVNTTDAMFSGFDTIAVTNSSPSGAFSGVQSGAVGNGGTITITTDKLTVDNGAQLVTNTSGHGDAGNVTIKAGDVLFKGISTNGSPSGVFSAIGSSGVGHGGNINVNVTTGSLSVTNGAQVSANTNTGGRGDAGSININARDTVLIDGFGGNGFPSSISSAVETGAVGNGGNLIVNAQRLNIFDGAVGTVSNQGSGNRNAGNLRLKANFINLDRGMLTADSTSGQGGNITLNVNNLLLMQHNSLISNTSGTTQASGSEGNFTLNTKFLVAPPLDNSDIVTNAFNGRGGKIDITASEGVFGFVVRTQQDLERLLGTTDSTQLNSRLLRTNDISAISQTNPIIITPDIDPSRGLVILPTVMQQAPKLVSSNCTAFNDTASGSNFTITGRGGLPQGPDEPLSSDVVWTDIRLPMITTQQHQHKIHAAKPKPQPIAIIPATGWVLNNKGEVTLISSVTNPTTLNTPTSCPAR